jgi:hypothetical protein
MSNALLRPARKRGRRRRAPVLVALVGLLAAGLATSPAAAAAPEVSATIVSNGPLEDEAKASAVDAEPGAALPKPRVPVVETFTQEELRERSHRRAVTERQNVYTDADTLDAAADKATDKAAGGDARTALAPGLDLPVRPIDFDVNECLGGDGATTMPGRVHNRFLYCRQREMIVDYTKIIDGVPTYVGTTEVEYQLIAYASKQSRTVRVFLRTQADSVDYERWRAEDRPLAPVQHVDVDLRCVNGTEPDFGCTIGGGAMTRTAAEWDAGVDWAYWDVESAETGSTGAELIRRHEWQLTFRGSPADVFQTIVPGHSALRTLRCDSATYIRYQSKACIFDDVIPHLTYSTASKKQHDVAVHIREAQDNPNSTYPLVENPPRDKVIPGKYTGNIDDPALHRLPKGASQLKDNTDHKNGACYGRGPVAAQYVGRGLPTRPPTGSDCDEYPFRSTVEGAANPDWDFSVKAVNRSQNRSAGASLGIYLDADRILYRDADAFYVEIVDTGEPGEDPDPVVVDAGPDKAGNEGSDIYLEGRADAAEEDSVSWSYRAVSDVDPGTTCEFADVHHPRTVIRCNDDGVFELTLTSDDGSDEAVSDTMQLTVQNVAPRWTRIGPENWTLYRVNTPVDLVAEFIDPGSNDTHECLVRWDDGLEDESAATGSNCNRRHTFRRAGMFTIDAWATDDDGGDTHFKTMVVVYDPDAGWTNADGSGNAPAGTHSARPTASGEGWFHLTARYYKPNDTKPVGTARAWLTPADFRFEAPGDANLEWLVVTPDGKVAAKGRGTVNGNGGRGFVMYGYDGCLDGGASGCQPGERDRFRTVVWDDYLNPGAFPLYDTYRGADYDVDRALPWTLTSGRVTIQR